MVPSLRTHLHRLGFVSSKSDNSLFLLRRGSDEAHLLLYVDDIILIASSTRLLHHIINQLRTEFAMKGLGPVHFFLSIQVRRTTAGFLFVARAVRQRDP